jgi:hypothetical protein
MGIAALAAVGLGTPVPAQEAKPKHDLSGEWQVHSMNGITRTQFMKGGERARR